jgi:hypothetical protein
METLKTTTKAFRASCRALALLLALSGTPAFAAPSVRPGPATALEAQFALESAGAGLVVAPADVQQAADLSQLTLLATGPLDLSRSGRLVRQTQHVLTPQGRVVATQDSAITVDAENGRVDITSTLSLGEGIGEYAGQPSLSGLKFEGVLALPLDEYRQALNDPNPIEAIQALGRRLSTHQQELLRTTVTAPSGVTISFSGEEMSLEKALEKVLPDEASPSPGPQPLFSIGCIRHCLAQLGVGIGFFQLICIGTAVVRCASLCSVLPPIPAGCIVCLSAVFAQCGVRLVIDQVRAFAHCIRGCF